VQSSKGIGEPPLFLGSTVFFALREAVRAARVMNGKEAGKKGGDGIWRGWNMDSPATCERLRLAVEDELVERARTVRGEGERSFFVSAA
jgi:xanthine dehydrogenase/oxidase